MPGGGGQAGCRPICSPPAYGGVNGCCQRHLRADRTRQPSDDQVVGVRDQAPHDVVIDRAVEVHGVPVPLVLVVAGSDPGVRRAQLERLCGVALEVDGPRLAGERHQREHLAPHLDHRDLLPERVCLLGPRQTEADHQDLVTSHGPSVASPHDGPPGGATAAASRRNKARRGCWVEDVPAEGNEGRHGAWRKAYVDEEVIDSASSNGDDCG